MNVFELLLQLGTVFLGAFLAFWLENLRERRQLKRWAKAHLRQEVKDIDLDSSHRFINGLERVVERYDECINQRKALYWQPIMGFSINISRGHDTILASAAVTTLPLEVVNQLREIDRRLRADKELSSICFGAYQQYTVPTLLEEHSLSTREIENLRYVKQLFTHRVKWLKEILELERELLELLDKHNLSR